MRQVFDLGDDDGANQTNERTESASRRRRLANAFLFDSVCSAAAESRASMKRPAFRFVSSHDSSLFCEANQIVGNLSSVVNRTSDGISPAEFFFWEKKCIGCHRWRRPPKSGRVDRRLNPRNDGPKKINPISKHYKINGRNKKKKKKKERRGPHWKSIDGGSFSFSQHRAIIHRGPGHGHGNDAISKPSNVETREWSPEEKRISQKEKKPEGSSQSQWMRVVFRLIGRAAHLRWGGSLMANKSYFYIYSKKNRFSLLCPQIGHPRRTEFVIRKQAITFFVV